MGKRTTEELRKAAEAMGLRKGRTIEVKEMLENGMENIKSGRSRKGTVKELFDGVFLCEMGKYKESFRYNELVGNEAGSKVRLRGV